MDHMGENRQMISLSRTDEVDDERKVHQEHGIVVTSCSLMMSDTAPSPARYHRQFDIVPKEIKSTKYVLDLGAPRLLSGIAICDDVDDSQSTSPSAETCRRLDYSSVVDALSTSKPCEDVRTTRKPVMRSRHFP